MPKVIVFRQKGDWKKSRRFLKRCSNLNLDELLDRYGQEGVETLAKATPKDTGKTAASWSYTVKREHHHYMEKLQYRGRCAHCGDPAIRTRHTERRIRRGRGLYQPCDAADF